MVNLQKPKTEILTGRFIPQRKNQANNSNIYFPYKDIENINMNQRAIDLSKESRITIPKLFKAHILGIKPAIPDNPITYSSQNILKYRRKIITHSTGQYDLGSKNVGPHYLPEEASLLHYANNHRKISPVPFKVLDAPAL